jgi:hypothetical protein
MRPFALLLRLSGAAKKRQEALLALVNGEPWDLHRPLESHCHVALVPAAAWASARQVCGRFMTPISRAV